MVRCPFCKAYISNGRGGVCECGEVLPEDFFKYRREKCLCGKTIPIEPIPSFPEELQLWETG